MRGIFPVCQFLTPFFFLVQKIFVFVCWILWLLRAAPLPAFSIYTTSILHFFHTFSFSVSFKRVKHTLVCYLTTASTSPFGIVHVVRSYLENWMKWNDTHTCHDDEQQQQRQWENLCEAKIKKGKIRWFIWKTKWLNCWLFFWQFNFAGHARWKKQHGDCRERIKKFSIDNRYDLIADTQYTGDKTK